MTKYYSDFNITKALTKENKIQFFTDGEPILVITVISNRILKVWADYKGTQAEEESYSVDWNFGKFLDFKLLDFEEYYAVATDEMVLRISKCNIHLEYYKKDNITLMTKDIGNEAMGWDDSGKVFLYHSLLKEEHFYGLGEDNDAYMGNMDRRGTTRDMITGQRINTGHVTADFPITFFMSTGSGSPYGMFTDNNYRMFYNMGKESEDYYYWRADGGALRYYFFAGSTLKDIISAYTDVTGKPEMLPLWTLGYMQCKCSYFNWDEIDETIARLKENRIPLDAIVFDYDWAEFFHNFKWHPRWEGKSPQKIAEYRNEGIHFMASNAGPMIKKDSDNFESGLKAGIFAKDQNGETITCGHYGGELMDFSNPDMEEWIKPQLTPLLEDGIEGWWLDLTEPEGDIAQTQYYLGSRDKFHNNFSLFNTRLYNKITLEKAPNKRPFLLTRTATAGMQKYATAVWSGDVYSDYKSFAAHVPEALNTAISGMPYWTSDTGGFISATNNTEDSFHLYQNDLTAHSLLYERWMQFSCFSPITRAHHAGESAPYIFDELIKDSIAYYLRLRYQMLAYIYTYTYRTHVTGVPLLRPLILEYTSDERVYNIKNQYLFGEELMVAPVIEENVSKRNIYFPEGIWYDWNYRYRYEGSQEYEVYAPQNKIPLFVKAGAIIPMLEQVMNTSQVDWKHIIFHIYPQKQTAFEMYTDDGISYEYQKKKFTMTTVYCKEEKGRKTILSINRSNLLYAADTYMLKVYVNAIPKSVLFKGKELIKLSYVPMRKEFQEGYKYDELQKILFITIKAGEQLEQEIEILYKKDKYIVHKTEKDILNGLHSSGQVSYLLPPSSVPCKVLGINFDRGGENISYHKVLPGNTDGLYRDEEVDIDISEESGTEYQISNLKDSEWLEYTVTVRKSCRYNFLVRLKCLEDAKISLSVNSHEESGIIPIKKSNWVTIPILDIYMIDGEQIIKIMVHTGNIHMSYINVVFYEV